MKHIISLGAGVQSSTMALMAAKGEITPMPDCAIFADTQDEPKSVYVWLDWLEKQLPFPIHRVTKGSLSKAVTNIRTAKSGNHYPETALPEFLINEQGKSSILKRGCTFDFKIEVIRRKVKEVIGKGNKCTQWIGISIDEADRMKDSQDNRIINYYPLVYDKRMNRNDCLNWMLKNGYPKPPRSACVFCPFHSDKEWLRLKTEEPEDFQKAVEFEIKYQEAMKKVTSFRAVPFLHRSCKPLSSLEFGANEADLFTNECEGMCGV